MKRNNTRLPLLGAFVLAMTAAPLAFAQEAASAQQQATSTPTQQETAGTATQQQGSSTWQSLDTDGNGSLSKAEVAGIEQLNASFEKIDGNADGEISQEEYRAYFEAQPKQTPPEAQQQG